MATGLTKLCRKTVSRTDMEAREERTRVWEHRRRMTPAKISTVMGALGGAAALCVGLGALLVVLERRRQSSA